jgi:hypothetical protein
VKHFWLFLHFLGFVMWLGGALGNMFAGIRSRSEPRDQLNAVARTMGAVYRMVILPGALLTVVSGLVLTLVVYGGPGAMLTISRWLMAMQGFGLIAALITLIGTIPTAARVTRVDAVTQAPQFDALRKRTARLGMISGAFGLLALIAGAMNRP